MTNEVQGVAAPKISSGDLVMPFIFVANGDDIPPEWLSNHPDTIRISATYKGPNPNTAQSRATSKSPAVNPTTPSAEQSPEANPANPEESEQPQAPLQPKQRQPEKPKPPPQPDPIAAYLKLSRQASAAMRNNPPTDPQARARNTKDT
jgi:hypothetical protein